MKIIIGLGNPGKDYENTRHNAGFMVMDALAKKCNLEFNKEKFSAYFAKGKVKGEDVILLKPVTFMNNSGFSLRQCLDFYKETMENVLVIYDDKDLPVGKIRLRQQGSAGGHKGIKSIMECTFNQDFNRSRVGIGKDERIPIIQWVLSKFRQEEMDDLNQAIEQASMAAYNAIDHSFDWVMNRYNKK